jgi:hypothetical protein
LLLAGDYGIFHPSADEQLAEPRANTAMASCIRPLKIGQPVLVLPLGNIRCGNLVTPMIIDQDYY